VRENAGETPDASAGPISPEQLAAELAGILRTGATTASLRGCPAILALRLVVSRAASPAVDDVASAALGVLQSVAIAVDGEPHGAAATLLGLAEGSRGALLKERRRRAATALDVSPAHFREEREGPMLEALADELYAHDSAYRLRQRHREVPERSAAASALEINWLERHQAYRRVWTPIAAMRDDLYVLLMFLREEADWPDLADRVMQLNWRYAQFSRELERFVDEYGGTWLLSDIESELAAADAVRRIDFHVPLGEADASWLRLALKQAPGQELDPFIDSLLAQKPRADELIEVWLEWAKTCSCDLDHSRPRRLRAPRVDGLCG
jgi:hypothetical protein